MAESSSTDLPSTEQANYKKLCKAYDDREFRKGIQLADQILAKAPLCSEVHAVKGLCLLNERLNDKSADKAADGSAENSAFTYIKNALAANSKSSALWHALGVYYKSENDTKEAFKCYKNAFRWDGERNTHTVMRDVTSMAIQFRDWETFSEVRQKALGKKSNVRTNWVTYAAAQHMLGNYELALGIIDVMGQVVGFGDNRIENGEVHTYRAELALLCKKPNVAVDILTTEKDILDQVVRTQLLARAYTQQGNKKKAEEKLLELYAMGLFERDTAYELASLRGIHVDPVLTGAAAKQAIAQPENPKFVELLDWLRAKYPRSDAPRRLALDYCPVQDLERRLREYCAPLIVKTVPSLTSVVKTLYASPARVAVLEKLFLDWERQLIAGDVTGFGDTGLPGNKPNPLWLVWVLQFLSSHYLRLKNFAKAHDYIDRAINHTPTIEMLHIHRAKIFHREGKLGEAAYHADAGRKLDLQDKYVNGKAVKYYLRNGDIEVAEKLLSLFHKASDVDEAWLNMFDLQCSWYVIELGDAFMKRDDVLSALQAYSAVDKFLKDNHEELLDYHLYTLRRNNIRPWLDVVSNDDSAASNRFYLKVAPKIIKAFLHVHHNGVDAVKAKHTPRTDVAALTKEADDKKRLDKLQKDNTIVVDLSKPLDSCQPYLDALKLHRPNAPETHELAVEVALLQGRPIVAKKAIVAADKHGLKDVAAKLRAQLAEWRSSHRDLAPAVTAALDA